MTPEQLVPTRDLCQKLVDNGIVLDTHFVWISYDDGNTWTITQKPLRVVKLVFVIIPAPTAEKLWDWFQEKGRHVHLTYEQIGSKKNITNALAELAVKVKES